MISSVNPATGQTIKEFPTLSDARIEEALASSQAAFERHRRTSFSERAGWLRQAADVLEREKRELGTLATLEMGKPLRQAIAEVEKCAWVCRFYADHAPEFLADEPVITDARESMIRYQPLGVVLAIMPWNFPYWQVFRFAAPALMAGNVGLLKHASNVPQCALAMQSVFERAHFTKGAFQALLVGSDKVEALIRDERVRAVTLTGSEAAGKSVAAQAGREIKKTVLELGGSDPFIIMPSADLKQAASVATQARVQNNGQSCIAAKRFIVAEEVADEFQWLLTERFKALKVGDPMEDDTDVGPLVNESGLKALDEQVHSLVASGGKVLTGGKRMQRVGNFYEPTIVAGVPPESPAAKEEIFGPVATLFRARDAQAAIAIANSTTFGLGSSVWTNDQAERERFIDELEAGSVFVNGMVKSDPRLPFGGVKASGYGRELSVAGIREFVNVKTVWIGPAKDGASAAPHAE